MVFFKEVRVFSERWLIWKCWADISIMDAKAFFVIFVTVFALFVQRSWSKDNMILEKI